MKATSIKLASGWSRFGFNLTAWRRACALTVAMITSTTATQAQSDHLVDVLYPQGGQAGTTVEVIAEGTFLSEPEEVVFYQPGIRCTKLVPHDSILDINTGKRIPKETGKAIRLTLEIASDTKPGEYQLRIRTRDGFSEMLTFWVTPFPIVMESSAWIDDDNARNDSQKTAQQLPRRCTVAGYLPGRKPQDHDWFSVECRKGERLTVEAIAARLGTLHYGGMNDPAIRIYNAAGRELGRNDDNSLHTQDPVVTVIVPEDGRYFVDMHQQMDYEPARLRHYLLHVGSYARPLVAFPLGGKAGTTLTTRLLGDASGEISATVTLPMHAGLYEQSFIDVPPPATPETPRPNRVHVTAFDDVTETGSINSPETAMLIKQPLPIAINGRIESEGEVDWYRFTAKKGERYRVIGYAKTFDSDLDARIWLRPAEGNSSRLKFDEDDTVWDQHDLVGHHYRHQTKIRLDPAFIFEPDTDGDWLIGIGDTRREFGPHHIYRIEFHPHVDSAFVHFPAYPSLATIVRDRIAVYRGNTYCRPVMVQPGFGSQYNKPLQLRAVDLPPGVTVECRPFLQGAGRIPVLFRAEANAKPGAHLIDLVVEPVAAADRAEFRGGFIQNNQATNRRGDYAMYFNRTRKMALAVLDGAAFNLEIERPQVPLVRNGELELKVKVQRHKGFSGAVYCEMEWLPEGVNRQPPVIIPADQTEGTYKLSAGSNAGAGEYQISITGRENEGGNVRTGAGFHYACSPFVPLAVGEPYVTVDLLRTAIERGQIGEIEAEIHHLKSFEGEAALQLGRLPFGVKQLKPFPRIKAGQEKVAFRVEVSEDCLVGPYRDICCNVSIQVGGQTIVQQTGNGLLRVDVERGASK